MRRHLALLVILTMTLMGGVTGCAAHAAETPRAHGQHPQDVEFYVAPHEDDEWEMWSQVENRPNVFKVFIVLARGEQTMFCLKGTGLTVGLQAVQGEIPPTPTPEGQWTPSCSEARLNSWLGFFGDMSKTDPTIPGQFGAPVATRQFDDPAGIVCRHDSPLGPDGLSVGPCTSANRSALVWSDEKGRGALVAFDLGEGDESAPEITWAIQNVLAHPTEFGVLAGLHQSALWGGYANPTDPACFEYANVDHVALHAALHGTRFAIPQQGAATCSTAPDVNLHAQVSELSMLAAFQIGQGDQRIGAHPRWYGWLDATWYHLSPTDPSELFQGSQSFWVTGASR